MTKTILMIGTYDTKQDELSFLEQTIIEQGAHCLKMDVSVLGEAQGHIHYTKHDVARLAGVSIDEIIGYDDENLAFQKMAQGASALTAELYANGKIDGMIALGGTMGTDLALDVASALPLGVPKYIISTVAFSPLISAQRIAPDVQMILWAGGLYGLNSLCRSTLSQAGGAVVGAAKAAKMPDSNKPMIGMTSLGKTALKYMTMLLPELEKRGFEVAVFHSTGLGGRAFEALASQGKFVCVMDFCVQEVINGLCGSPVNSGGDRLSQAGKAGIPQMIAPGASDIIDILGSAPKPPHLAGRENHAHNRLIDSVLAIDEEREHLAKILGDNLSKAKAPVEFFIPLQGMIEWDKPNMPLHNPSGLSHFIKALREHVSPRISTTELDCHINDQAFVDAVLDQFDDWVEKGIVQKQSQY